MKTFLKKSLLFILALILLVGCAAGDGGTDNEEVAENEQEEAVTITFGVTPWTSTIPPTKVARLVLEDMGYTVEEIEADAGGVYAGM